MKGRSSKGSMNTRAILCLLLASASGWAQPQLKTPKSLWYLDNGKLTPERISALSAELPKWQAAGVFDGFTWPVMPPTFLDPQPVIALMNSMNVALKGTVIASTLPVGNEGWETSNNARLAAMRGYTYDAAKAVSERQWLQSIQTLQVNTWAWVLGQPAKMPTPDQAANSAATFVSAVKAQHKKAVIWLSAQALRLPMFPEICAATKDTADAFVWMDLPSTIALNTLGHKPRSAKEAEMSPAMLAELNKALDTILALTPKEKTYIQWISSPNLPTQDVAGTTAYIAACQAKGIENFAVEGSVNLLQKDPWRAFYMSLAKNPAGRSARQK
jgi:hypothetical protein